MSNSRKTKQKFIETADGQKRPVFLHDDHKRPSNRREFLASGLLGFSGLMMTPSILSILGSSDIARAASDSCGASAAVRLPAFVGVNLAGGAALAGNYIALDQGGSMLKDYSQLGLGMAPPPIEYEFGKVAFGGAPAPGGRLAAQFLDGIRQAASASTLAKASFIAICVPLQDDSSANMIDATGLVTAAGLVGDMLPKMGSRESVTGLSNMPAVLAPPAPLVVRNIQDILAALNPAGAFAKRLSTAEQLKVLKLVNSLSGSQARAIAQANSSSGQTLSKLVQCATDKNIQLSQTTNPGVDPRSDADKGILNLWNMSAGTTDFGRNQNDRTVMGSMVYNALKGNAGTVSLEVGGYDYHGSQRAQSDMMDQEAGHLVGMVLESAAVMNQKVFIHVMSDGSVGSSQGSDINAQFNGDRGSGGMSFILAFDPAGRPALKNPMQYQLGSFTAGQGADDKSLVGSATLAGTAVFANYLQFAKQINLFEKVTNQRPDAATMDAIIKLA
jgi:hypothetical protein